jgi:hypothetical protein
VFVATKLNLKRVSFIVLLLLTHLSFSYYYFPWFWSSLIGFVIILFLSYKIWKNAFIFWIGIPVKRKELLISLLLLIIFFAGSFAIILLIARNNQIEIRLRSYKTLVHSLFYTLNEEIIIGALLLKGIRHRWKKLSKPLISLTVALAFALVHFIFYKLIFVASGNLSLITIVTLFLVGVFRNNLILKTGHIGYSWALHFGWIYVMLGCQHLNLLTAKYLTDFDRFQMYLGDFRVMIISLVLAGFSFYLIKKKLLFPDYGHPIA